jgi:hypothetical protein
MLARASSQLNHETVKMSENAIATISEHKIVLSLSSLEKHEIRSD